MPRRPFPDSQPTPDALPTGTPGTATRVLTRLALAGLLTAGAAGAQSTAGAPRTPGTAHQVVMTAARTLGPVKMSTTDQGDPLLTGESDGLKYGIFFSGCDARGDHCEAMRLVSYWDAYPAQDLNTWNRTKFVGRAYLDDDGTTLDLWVSLLGGLTAQQIADVMDWWSVALTDFASYLEDLK
ncbi:YbjN domain-containing protein [Deinococcus enclensis]|uniref:Sensory transduction regulator n=1 Tax=Deinococcus enclensis TaxID=1049582 RepID=A0ABT9MFY1_9DEIO|nr:YbjN domain-containing protein [Deinococcus enclensis]MDP9765511.1 hypothetical protein [Deinococcus enclensis]